MYIFFAIGVMFEVVCVMFGLFVRFDLVGGLALFVCQVGWCTVGFFHCYYFLLFFKFLFAGLFGIMFLFFLISLVFIDYSHIILYSFYFIVSLCSRIFFTHITPSYHSCYITYRHYLHLPFFPSSPPPTFP